MPLALKFPQLAPLPKVLAAICIMPSPQMCSQLLCRSPCSARNPSTCPAVPQVLGGVQSAHSHGHHLYQSWAMLRAREGAGEEKLPRAEGCGVQTGQRTAAGIPAASSGVTRGRAVPGQQAPQDAPEELHWVRGTGSHGRALGTEPGGWCGWWTRPSPYHPEGSGGHCPPRTSC